jgi:uncharacterized membrane protein
MATHNVDLMTSARECLKGRWNLLIRATTIFIFIEICSIFIAWNIDLILPITKNTSLFGDFINSLFSIGSFLTFILLTGPLSLGFIYFCRSISLIEDAKIAQIFYGYKNIKNSVSIYFLIHLFTILWTLLLIIPGLIAQLSYAMAPFILIEDTSISPLEAIRKSKKMMDGYKVKLLGLSLRFSLWFIFSILTFGIGFFWTIPYFYVSLWKFYEDIKEKAEEEIIVI